MRLRNEAGTDPATDQQLRHRNRRLLAERLQWPFGALKACEQIEARYPDWAVFWMRENTTPGFERPAGFHAVREDLRRVERFAPEVERLIDAIILTPPDENPVFRWIKPSKRR